MPRPSVQRLQVSLDRLDEGIRRWSNARWASPAADGRTRSEVARELALTLAVLARQAGNGAPRIEPPPVAPHGIADQLAVLGRELTGAPDIATNASVTQAAEAAVERAVNLF